MIERDCLAFAKCQMTCMGKGSQGRMRSVPEDGRAEEGAFSERSGKGRQEQPVAMENL